MSLISGKFFDFCIGSIQVRQQLSHPSRQRGYLFLEVGVIGGAGLCLELSFQTDDFILSIAQSFNQRSIVCLGQSILRTWTFFESIPATQEILDLTMNSRFN
ncbi:hypothetical protein WM24_28630 [Burkholderia ubonensis]|nr:hypothetical protein WM24_28630 [Burkholderia ubonensis]